MYLGLILVAFVALNFCFHHSRDFALHGLFEIILDTQNFRNTNMQNNLIEFVMPRT